MPKFWTDDRINLLIGLGNSKSASGQTWTDIGQMFDVSESAARNKYKRELNRREEVEEEEGFIVEERKNSMVVTAKFAEIKTLDGMLEACEVNLNIWRVDRYMINKWPIGAKAARKDIRWDDGRMTGSLYEDGLVIAPLFQVKVWLIRIKPEPIFPTIQPIVCPRISVSRKVHTKEGKIRRSLIWCDPHFGFVRGLTGNKPLIPFHNRDVLDVVLQVAMVADVDRVDVLGDLLDCTDWTDKYLRTPEFTETTQPALLEAYWWLSQFREICEEMNLLEGNHGGRIMKSIVKHLRAAYDLRAVDELDLPPAVSLPKLLALDKLGINYVGNYPCSIWLNKNIKLLHGVITSVVPGAAARKVVEKSDTVQIFGHNHQLEWVTRMVHRQGKQTQICGFSPGCTCWTDGRVPGSPEGPQWHNACAVVDYEVEGPFYSINPVIIEDGKAIYSGQWIYARDRVDELAECFKDWKFA